jgi:hypothetical protein
LAPRGEAHAVAVMKPGKSAEFQLIYGRDAKPAFVVVPYEVWTELVAKRLDAGSLTALEEIRRYSRPGRLAPAPSAAGGAADRGLAQLAPLSAVPPVPRPEDLKPALESVQIEGARVLPEVDQTLDEIGNALDRVETTSLSVQPAPDGIGAIGSALDEAAARVAGKLSDV